MKALRLNGHEELLGYRLGELLLREPLRTDRLVAYVESKSGTPGSYLLVDEGGAAWAVETLAKMDTAHVADRELLLGALQELIEDWRPDE